MDRDGIWQILWHYGVPEKIVKVIRCFYSGFECQVIHDGFLTEPYQVRTGVRQGAYSHLHFSWWSSIGLPGKPMELEELVFSGPSRAS